MSPPPAKQRPETPPEPKGSRAVDLPGIPALVVGATRGLGLAIAREYLERGKPVRVIARDAKAAIKKFGSFTSAQIVEADARDAEAIAQHARGCGTIVHTASAPLSKWKTHVTPMLEATIDAAAKSGCSILYPGNVWNLGSPDGPIDEDHKALPTTRKGAIKQQHEEMLRVAARDQGVRVLIVRAPDYYGPTVRNGLIDRLFASAVREKPIEVLGELGAKHQWAYVPDLARACVDLLELGERVGPARIVHFPGHTVESQQSFAEMIARAAGWTSPKIKQLGWTGVWAGGLVNKDLFELMEQRYLFDEGVFLESKALPRLLPKFEATPIEQAIAQTVGSYKQELR